MHKKIEMFLHCAIASLAFLSATDYEDEHIHWYVRYMRGNFYINLPGTFGKRRAAEEDFLYIYKWYMANPEIEKFMCNGFYWLGEIEKSRGNIDEAIECWKKSVALGEKLGLNSIEAKKSANCLELRK